MAAANEASTATSESRRMATTLAQRGERLGEKIDTLGDNARDMLTRGKERAGEWGDDIATFVKDEPIKSLLIAAAVGLVLGALLVRR